MKTSRPATRAALFIVRSLFSGGRPVLSDSRDLDFFYSEMAERLVRDDDREAFSLAV